MIVWLITVIGYGAGSIYVLWLFYLAVMNLKRAKDAGTISKTALYLGYPLLFIGLLLDMLVNTIVMSALLLELPRWNEILVTGRISRHAQQGGWRGDIARWLCESLLDRFDPSGVHCKL